MSFIEGMVLCFIGGWANSYIYRRFLRKKNKGWLLWFAIIFLGGLITFDMLIYSNVIDVRSLFWVKIPKGADPGKYWLFNPGLLFGLNFGSITPTNELIWDIYALSFFISYIWWFTVGQNLGRFMYGRLEYERGAWYILRSTKMIKRAKEKMEREKGQKS